jgi:hypothetical protein
LFVNHHITGEYRNYTVEETSSYNCSTNFPQNFYGYGLKQGKDFREVKTPERILG